MTAPFLKNYYGDAEGPLGFPMPDRAAQALDRVLKDLPKDDAFAYRKVVVPKAPTELMPGERSDVSWISTEDPDRQSEVVLARGMNDAHFQLNPLVTLNHAYWLPPVGRSLWRKVARDGDRKGVKAKTQYPARPEAWPAGADWPPDTAFTLVQAGLLRGKSIGFLPVKVHAPTEKEVARPGWEGVRLVIDEWILLEYACVFLPAQPHALVEQVSKAAAMPEEFRKALGVELVPEAVPFTPLAEIEKAMERRWRQIDVGALVRGAASGACDRLRGRV
jgi:hypothetical protein